MNGITYGTATNQYKDKNGNIWCGVKGKICPYATIYGQCSVRSACKETLTNYSGTMQETLPDCLIINGIKYVKEKGQ